MDGIYILILHIELCTMYIQYTYVFMYIYKYIDIYSMYILIIIYILHSYLIIGVMVTTMMLMVRGSHAHRILGIRISSHLLLILLTSIVRSSRCMYMSLYMYLHTCTSTYIITCRNMYTTYSCM